MSFYYHDQWVSLESSRPLSQSLPLRLEKFNEKECSPFFGGLLPEERNREIVARNLGITPRNDYTMLCEIGGECAGAVSLISMDEKQPVTTRDYETISKEELIEILNQLLKYVFRWQGHKARLHCTWMGLAGLARV